MKKQNIRFTVTLSENASDLLKQALVMNEFDEYLEFLLEDEIQKAASETVIRSITDVCRSLCLTSKNIRENPSAEYSKTQSYKDMLLYAQQLELRGQYRELNSRLHSLNRYLSHLEEQKPYEPSVPFLKERDSLLQEMRDIDSRMKANNARLPEEYPHVQPYEAEDSEEE